MIYHVIFLLLFMMGFFCLLTEKNLVKLVIGISLMESAVFFWTITLAGNTGGFPIYDLSQPEGMTMVDPVPQALTLTAIVIGASTTALLLTLMIELVRQTRTLDVNAIEGLRE